MSGPSTVTRQHLDRLAMIYVRQSTLTQVREHTESTARQYALAEAAQRLGWEDSRIVTIDADLGLSGRTASGRVGFKELVSRVCLGEVGAIFFAFEQTGSAYGVVGCFHDRPFPRRAYGGAWAGEIRWGRLTHDRALGLLSNPAYAGAYVFGRYHSQRVVDPDGTIRTRTLARPRSEWAVIIQDHHPAYIRWETFLANQQRLAAN